MSIDRNAICDELQAEWRRRDTILISNMAQRLELALTWLDLDWIVTDSVTVMSRPNGVWAARNNPAAPGRGPQIRQSAVNALSICSRHGHRVEPLYSRANVHAAKKLARDAIYAYALPARA